MRYLPGCSVIGQPIGKAASVTVLVRHFPVVTQTIPGFILALLIIYFLGVKLKAVKFFTGDGNLSILMAILIMALYRIGPWARVVRNAFREEMKKSYVRFAIPRGVPKGKVLFIHAARPVLCSLVATVDVRLCERIRRRFRTPICVYHSGAELLSRAMYAAE